MIDSPWLPNLPVCKNIRSRSNLGVWGTGDKSLGLGMPCSQFFEGIRLYLKSVFVAPVVDDIATELGLEDVVAVENIGAKFAESQFGDALARGSQVHNKRRRPIDLKVAVGN